LRRLFDNHVGFTILRRKEIKMVATRSKKKEEAHSARNNDKDNKKTKREEAKKESDSEDSGTKAPQKKKQKTKNKKQAQDTIGGLQLEYAKSGRSTCRKCSENIDKGAPRVGVEAWISGRQSMTWQHVTCFLSTLTCGYEKTGRSKCSVEGELIEKGLVKLTAHSHTATRHYKLDVLEKILSVVLSWVPFDQLEDAKSSLSLEGIDGIKDLKKEDQEKLESILSGIKPLPSKRGFMADKEDQAKPEERKTKTSSTVKEGDLDIDGKP